MVRNLVLISRYEKNSINRTEWIDCAKGITILLVIIGHTIEGALRGAIFSFHMPLFFILSCITYKYSANGNQFLDRMERAFCHLIIPGIIISALRTVIRVIKDD